ncbi:MAG: glycosyltransferase family protein [Thermoleophilia bacterium]
MSKNALIILDSYKYKGKEAMIRKNIESLCNPAFFYTDYENNLIKYFHGLKFVGNFLSHISYWTISLVLAAEILAKKKSHEIIIFVNPIVGYFYCFMLSLFKREDTVCIAGFIFEKKENRLYLALRRKFVNFAYRSASCLIVYSNIEVEQYGQMFPKLANRFKFVRYGRDYDIFGENKYSSAQPYVASGGGSNRDFGTLITALKILEKKNPEIFCQVATRHDALSITHQPANLQVLHEIRIDRFGSFLENSLFVVIPIKNNFISAGHMALLESMYRQKVIIATDVPVVRDYASDSEIFFYQADDSNELAERMDYVFNNIKSDEVKLKALAAKNKYQSDYTFNKFIYRLIENCI